MRLADAGAADADVRLLEFFLAGQHEGVIDWRREFFYFAVARDAAEQPGAFRGQPFVLDLAGGGDEDAAGTVARRHERGQQIAIDFIDRLDGAENRQRQRMALPELFVE